MFNAYDCVKDDSIPYLIATKKINVIELVDNTLSNLDIVGRKLSALAWLNVDQAKADAIKIDNIISCLGREALKKYPLLGLPITVKEGLKVAGAPWMMGSSFYKNRIADKDGTVVSRLRSAGAIIVGLGAMSERALWPETVNKITGRALHPFDSSRTPGGSSGGDAALVASNAITVAIGTDGGGSIRIPASYCGLYAHKPTARMVPLTGHMPIDVDHSSNNLAEPLARFFSPGPMTKRAVDLWPLLSIMAGADNIQQDIDISLSNEIPSAQKMQGRKVYVLSNPKIFGTQKFDTCQINAVQKAAGILEQQGAVIKFVRDDLLLNSFAIWLGTLRNTANCSLEYILGNGSSIHLSKEIILQLFGKGRYTIPSIFLTLISRLDITGPKTWQKWDDLGKDLKNELAEMLDSNSIMLCPPVQGAAPKHNSAFLYPFNIAPCAVFNALGNPATIAPILLGKEGLPRSVQIIASPGQDHLTISAALALEKAVLFNQVQ